MLYAQLSTPQAPADGDMGYATEVWRTLDDLYAGGWQALANAKRYMRKALGESGARYQERMQLASYIPYLPQIIHVYAAALFGQPVAVTAPPDAEDSTTPGEPPEPEIYEGLATDADLRGTPFAGVLQAAVTTALLKKRGLLCCDFPAKDGAAPTSLADSDAQGLGQPYVYDLAPEAMVRWRYVEQIPRTVDIGDGKVVRFSVGRFAWCIIKTVSQDQPTPDAPLDTITETYKVWQCDPESGEVSWEEFKVQYPKGKKPKPNQEVPGEGKQTTTFREIPIVELCLPDPLWIGNIAGPLCLEHWVRRSALLSAQQRALLTIPTVYLGPQLNGPHQPIPANVAQDQSRGEDPRAKFEGQGYLVLAAGDKLAFEGPSTAPFEVVAKQLNDLVDEIFRVTGRMAASISNTSIALGRSGESKAADNADFCVVLKALGAIVRDAARRAYTIVSQARAEDVRWVVHGLDSFDPEEDRSSLITELTQLFPLMPGPGAGIDIRSPTALAELQRRAVIKLLPGMSPDQQSLVADEIKSGLEKKAADEEAAKAASLAAAQAKPPVKPS